MSAYFDNKTPRLPQAKLAIVALKSCTELGKKIDQHVVNKRKEFFSDTGSSDIYLDHFEETYLIPVDNVRFSNGEGKAVITETVRGKDIYILADVGNYSISYQMFGITTLTGPDEHFQDIKRTISAIGGKANRITVIMPLLYASRQDKRKSRESLDCAIALQELERLGVDNIITFDAHEPKVQNAIPSIGFESLHATYGILKELIEHSDNLIIDKDKMMIVSPDSGAMDRAIYYASVLGLDIGLFYKRRDYSQIVNGRNPIVQHEYMGRKVEGKNILIVDDMIASGQSVLDLVDELNRRKCGRIFIAVSFAFFTEGFDLFDQYYEKGYFEKVISTNLTYVPPKLKDKPWFLEADMSKHISNMIHKLNYNESVSSLFDATAKIKEMLIIKNKLVSE